LRRDKLSSSLSIDSHFPNSFYFKTKEIEKMEKNYDDMNQRFQNMMDKLVEGVGRVMLGPGFERAPHQGKFQTVSLAQVFLSFYSAIQDTLLS
jgi:hypothetical protein